MMQKQRKFAGHAYRCRLHENDRRGFGHIHQAVREPPPTPGTF